MIYDLVDEQLGQQRGGSRSQLIQFVKVRPGHDRRYAIDRSKQKNSLGWQPGPGFAEGHKRTVDWYLSNQ